MLNLRDPLVNSDFKNNFNSIVCDGACVIYCLLNFVYLLSQTQIQFKMSIWACGNIHNGVYILDFILR